MRIKDVITPGDKIDIRLTHKINAEENGGETAQIYQSSVADYLSDTELEILMPTREGRVMLFQVGAEMEFTFFTRHGMYNARGTVTKRYRIDNLFLLAVQIRSELVKFQRREFFRIDCMIDIEYYKIREEVAELPTTAMLFAELLDVQYIGTSIKGTMMDISGGGLRFSSKEQLQRGDFILLVIRLTNDRMDETFYLVGEVMAGEPHPNLEDLFMNRAKFIFKDLKDREKIVRFVYDEERRIRKKEIG